jgi:hypothetical protein
MALVSITGYVEYFIEPSVRLSEGVCNPVNCVAKALLTPINPFKTVIKVMLRSPVSRPVSLGLRHPSGAQDQIFITVRQLRVYGCGDPSLTRGRICRLQLLLVLARAVIFNELPLPFL